MAGELRPTTTIEAEEPASESPSNPRADAASGPRPSRQAQRRARAEADAELDAAARALFETGQAEQALALLGRAVLFAAHEPTSLPCLCRACLRPEVFNAEHAGVRYQRDFVVAEHRVLFFWAPAELASDAKSLRASMRAALVEQLRARRRGDEKPRPAANPFTGETIEIPATDQRQNPLNPLTGKRVP